MGHGCVQQWKIKLTRGKSITQGGLPSYKVISMANNAANIYSLPLFPCYSSVEFYCQTVAFTFPSFQICENVLCARILRRLLQFCDGTADWHECRNANAKISKLGGMTNVPD